MALEDLTGSKYIDSLVVTNPAAGDNVSEGDDHIRGIKNTIKNTFPNINGAVTATDEELNYVDGVTSNIQSQIDNIELFPSGTAMFFQQTSAPTGWTKSTTHNNKAIRIVSGTVGTGGNSAFTTAFASYTPSGNVSVAGSVNMSGNIGSTTLSTAQIPSHSHGTNAGFGGGGDGSQNVNQARGYSYMVGVTYANTNSSGGGGSHNHNHNLSGALTVNSANFSGSAKDLAVQYVDTIIATKD